MDMDIYNHSERHLIVGYREERCYFVDFKTRSVNPFEPNMPSIMSMIQYL